MHAVKLIVGSIVAMIELRMQFALPALRELARQRGDYMYDGIGMNAAVLVMGWVAVLRSMMFKLAQSAFREWRRLNCHEKMILGIEGCSFKDGIMQEEIAA